MKNYIVVYGGFLKNGELHRPDTASSCDKAIEIARSLPNSVIVFGVGPQVSLRPVYGERLAGIETATVQYLINHGWPSERILCNPNGYDTLTETAADIEALSAEGARSAICITRWYHMPRTWLIWKLLRQKYPRPDFAVRFRASWKTSLIRLPFSLAWEVLGFAKLFLQLLAANPLLKPQT